MSETQEKSYFDLVEELIETVEESVNLIQNISDNGGIEKLQKKFNENEV